MQFIFFNKVYDKKKLQFLEIDFIYPVQCEIFAEFSGEITFGISAKMAEIITRKLHAWVAPGQTKTTIARKLLPQHGRLELMLVVNTTL